MNMVVLRNCPCISIPYSCRSIPLLHEGWDAVCCEQHRDNLEKDVGDSFGGAPTKVLNVIEIPVTEIVDIAASKRSFALLKEPKLGLPRIKNLRLETQRFRQLAHLPSPFGGDLVGWSWILPVPAPPQPEIISPVKRVDEGFDQARQNRVSFLVVVLRVWNVFDAPLFWMEEEINHFVSDLEILAAAEIFVDPIHRAERGIAALKKRNTA